MNSKYEILNSPNGMLELHSNRKVTLKLDCHVLWINMKLKTSLFPSTITVKLIGDGTQIIRSLNYSLLL